MRKLIYHELRSATESEKVGSWPQLEAAKYYWKVKSNFKSLDFRKFPDEVPDLNTFNLNRIAQRTDVLSADMLHASIGIFVSDAFKHLVHKYHIHNFRFYDCLLTALDPGYNQTKKPEQFPFNFLHLIQLTDIIDFKQSVFWDMKAEKFITVACEEELPMFNRPKKIVLKEVPDLFREPFGTDILVSERLKAAIESAGITGIWLREYNSPANPELFLDA